MENTVIDSLGNTVVMTYDAGTDTVKVKIVGIDSDFRAVTRQAMWNPNLVLELETPGGGDDDWNNYSDEISRYQLREFWLANKVDQN